LLRNIGFVADNVRVKMRVALDALLQDGRLDACTAFLDAFGIATIGGAVETAALRLLVGYNLSEFPLAQDVVTFQMADEWHASGQDPVHRLSEDSLIQSAVAALQHSNFEVAKAARKTHAKLYLGPDLGVVGSSNLTRPGLEGQRELNLLQYDPEAIARLREWFETHWREAKAAERSDFKAELIEWLLSSRLRRFAPFHPYAKAIFERFRNRFLALAPTATDVDLAVFQEEGRDIALGILAEHKCCIIADAVGLGKTYVALGAMHRRAKGRDRHQRRILVVCPAQLKGMWERAGQDQNIHLVTASMESLGHTAGAAAERRPQDLAEYALVIVDEAHNFRNHRAKRFQTLMEVLQLGPQDKEVLLLTATPINNGIGDLYSLYRLMTRDRDAENPINRFHDLLNEVVQMLQEFGIEEVNRIPFGCQSNKRSTHRGLFLCVAAGTREEQKHCWWLYYPFDGGTGGLFPEPVQEPGQIIELIRSARPPTADLCRPDYTPRDIRWSIILDAKKKCREMLLEQARNEAQGQVWPATHVNKKLKTFLAARQIDDPTDVERRLGRFSLERHKNTAEKLMHDAQQTRNITPLLQWLDETLPRIAISRDNPETIPLEIVSYLELVPETEAAV
jgi:hypothetical protein